MKIYLYILVAGLVSTLVRVLPATLLQKKIENTFFQSFLYYLPYITLSVMTFPAILNATDSWLAGLIALIVSILVAYLTSNLFVVAISSSAVVLIITYIIPLL